MARANPIERFRKRLWPHMTSILVMCGLGLFASACICDSWPEASLYAGPGVMLVGVILMARNNGRSRH